MTEKRIMKRMVHSECYNNKLFKYFENYRRTYHKNWLNFLQTVKTVFISWQCPFLACSVVYHWTISKEHYIFSYIYNNCIKCKINIRHVCLWRMKRLRRPPLLFLASVCTYSLLTDRQTPLPPLCYCVSLSSLSKYFIVLCLHIATTHLPWRKRWSCKTRNKIKQKDTIIDYLRDSGRWDLASG